MSRAPVAVAYPITRAAAGADCHLGDGVLFSADGHRVLPEMQRGNWKDKRVTPRQLAVRAFVAEFTAKRGYPPTFAEIGGAFGKTKAGIWYTVRALVRHRLLAWDRGTVRSLRVIGSAS